MSKKTRQGVRDLNGPRMNGESHNGHKTTCRHPPGLALSATAPRVIDGRVVMVRVKYCGICEADVTALHADQPPNHEVRPAP